MVICVLVVIGLLVLENIWYISLLLLKNLLFYIVIKLFWLFFKGMMIGVVIYLFVLVKLVLIWILVVIIKLGFVGDRLGLIRLNNGGWYLVCV